MPPGDSRENPRARPTSRIILLDPSGRTLLFTVEEPDHETGKRIWFPPGGGVEPGESYEEAARRELREETGLEVPIGPCIWLRDPTTYFVARDQTWYRFVQRFFVAYTDQLEIQKDGWTDLELQVLSDQRWWTLEEIAASKAAFTPRCLAEVLPPILAGQIPTEPIEIGI